MIDNIGNRYAIEIEEKGLIDLQLRMSRIAFKGVQDAYAAFEYSMVNHSIQTKKHRFEHIKNMIEIYIRLDTLNAESFREIEIVEGSILEEMFEQAMKER